MKRLVVGAAVVLMLSGSAARTSRANFHFWDISEVYTSADGSVQFIELFTTAGGQQFVANHQITTTAKTFRFPANSPDPTANHHLLLATDGFGSLPGGVAPDYTIPANFFNPAGDTVNFVGANSVTFAAAPTDSKNSLHYPGAMVKVNSPTNYAGLEGSVVLPSLPDYNGDMGVNAADYTLWRDTLGSTSNLAADGDSSGTVDAGDFVVWKAEFGTAAGAAASAAVPEPSFIVLLVCTLAVCTSWRR